jgi:hypothetical protein
MHVARKGERSRVGMFSVGEHEGKRTLERTKYRREDNIKMNLKEMGWEYV